MRPVFLLFLTYTLFSQNVLLDKVKNKSDFQNRSSFSYHLNLNKQALEHQQYELKYGRKFNKVWASLYTSQVNTSFGQIKRKNEFVGINTDSNTSKPNNSNANLFLAGIGAEYEPSIHFLKETPLNLSIQAHLLYMRLEDSIFNETYTGPGLKGTYGLVYKNAERMHIGFNLAYHIAKGEKNNQVNLITNEKIYVAWTSLGVDLSFYF